MEHNFNDSLAKSKAQEDNPIWEIIYRNAFVNFSCMNSVREDGWAQRGGIDRVVMLKSGKTLTVDEKIRETDYGDILLEYWSSKESRIPGWVAKDLACDYIAYAVIPSNKCYLLPFQQLRLAWKLNHSKWVKLYKEIHAKNSGYTTISVAIPIDVLLKSLNDAMIVSIE